MSSIKTIIFSFILLSSFSWTFSLSAQEIRVEDIKFKGNKEISSGKLQNAMQTRANPWYRFFLFWMQSQTFDEEKFFNDLLRVEKLYQQEGFLNARVEDYQMIYSENGEEVNLVITVEEGQRVKVDGVRITYEDRPPDGFEPQNLSRHLKLQSGKYFREADLWTDYNRIVRRFNNRGYPYIEANVKPVLDKKDHSVNLEWRIKPGPLCTFGDIRFTGNESVSSRVIRRGLGFRPGQLFAHNKLLDAQSQIYRLELFQFVSLRATNLERQPIEIPIEVRLKESVLRTLKFGAGFASEESFRGSVEWRHRNFLGGARILRMKAKHSRRLLPLEIEAELSQPYFLDNQNDLIVRPFFIIQDEPGFKTRRIGFEIGLNRQLNSSTNLFTTARVERDSVELKGSTVTAETEDLYSKSVLKIGLRRNTTDALFSPTGGSTSTLVFEDAGRFFKTKFEYFKLYGEHKIYRRLDSDQILASRLFVGSMKATGANRLTPLEEKFFSGGSFSVRGWERQALGPVIDKIPQGGNSIIEGSVELRQNLYKKFSGVMFLDFGNVWQTWNGFDLYDLHYAIGGGLRFDTVVGPIRFDFAWKVNKQVHDTQNYQIHFSIGQAF